MLSKKSLTENKMMKLKKYQPQTCIKLNQQRIRLKEKLLQKFRLHQRRNLINKTNELSLSMKLLKSIEL